MRLLPLTAIFLFALPISAQAQDNCLLYDTLGRMNEAMEIAVENPNTALMKVNVNRVASELLFLDTAAVPDRLRGKISTDEIAIIQDQIAFAKRIALAQDVDTSMVVRQLAAPQIKQTLTATGRILQPLFCSRNAETSTNGAGIQQSSTATGHGQQIGLSLGTLPKITGNISLWFGIPLLGILCTTLIGRRIIRRIRQKRRRRARRIQINQKVSFATGAHNYPGRLRDISRVGCRLSHRGVIGENHRRTIKLYFAGEWVAGKIAWHNAKECGVMFDRMMTRAELFKRLRANRNDTAGVIDPLTAAPAARKAS